MKSPKLILPIILSLSFSLAACGGGNEDEKAEKTNSGTSISEGAKEMQKTIAELKTQLNDKDSAKVKKSGEELEESWEKFEDNVKDKDKELYEKVETPLHTIEAGAKSEPLDVNTLSAAADELNNTLTEVKNLK